MLPGFRAPARVDPPRREKEHTMGDTAATPGLGGPMDAPDAQDAVRAAASFWWVWLVAGIAWMTASLVVLQFDEASVKTIGVLVGIMFVLAGLQQLAFAAIAGPLRWLWAIVGVLFLVSGVVCFVNPEETFAGLADVLGFLFLVVGVWWTMRAFVERGINPVWWLGLISGILMVILAFWTSGQFFIEKAYTLLIFAGLWALMHGITDIARAFAIRALRDEIR
jgi:uncharacterized membrane protein HdeD (DUF308 family)